MTAEQEVQPSVPAVEEVYEEDVQQEAGQEHAETEQTAEPPEKMERNEMGITHAGRRGGFVNGLSVGLGIGCIATFVITWISLFFTPQMPTSITYESLLTIFIYPLIYVLAVGLIALTAGIVREYYPTGN